eukprot:GILJ01002526.1.p1 GENE.GILJ01002526.1~~GILJ01002526.1.p1  ORF type:complete len:658 (+),score=115.19 GILJ01002526.1:40-1974(+)
MKVLLCLLALVVASASLPPIEDGVEDDMCTTMVFGKKATADGSVMTTHTADCKECDSRFFYVPAADHEEGDERPVYLGAEFVYFMYPRYKGYARGPGYYPAAGEKNLTKPIGSIPQVRHTFAYFDTVYGVMNEHQVGIGESTCAAKISALPVSAGGHALFDLAELTRIAMERARTAREALELVTSLAEKHGFYGGWFPGHATSTAGEAMTIIDPNEAWILHIMASPDGRSAVWAAQRVPDDEVAVVSNHFIIRELDLSKPDFFKASANVIDAAVDLGYYDPETDGPFDFARVYSPVTFGNNYTYVPLYASLRTWRIFSEFAPAGNWIAEVPDVLAYPFSVKPESKITLEQVFKMQRDYFEGTDYDLSKGMGAGPFGTPIRWDGASGERAVKGQWARAVSIQRTSYSTVLQARDWLPSYIGGIVWLGQDAPHTSVYVPLYAGIKDTPVSYRTGYLSKFSRDSAWWAFDFVSNFADIKYSYMIQDIRAEQNRLEGRVRSKQQEVEEKAVTLYKEDPEKARNYLTQYCLHNAEDVVASWWNLSEYLITKYNDGYINIPTIGATTGYPEWWLRLVKFDGDARYKMPANGPTVIEIKEAAVAANGLGLGAVCGILTFVAVLCSTMGFVVGRRKTMPVDSAYNTIFQQMP